MNTQGLTTAQLVEAAIRASERASDTLEGRKAVLWAEGARKATEASGAVARGHAVRSLKLSADAGVDVAAILREVRGRG